MKLMITTPTLRDSKWDYNRSMEEFLDFIMKSGVNSQQVTAARIPMNQCSLLPSCRQQLLDTAIVNGFSHILMVDDDIKFPKDILDGMVKRNVPALALNYCKKKYPLEGTCVHENRFLISSFKTGIEQIEECGLGFFLLDLSVMKDIPKPHFEVKWHPELNEYKGEDIYFVHKLQEHGVKIHVDHDASKRIEHIGDHGFRWSN